MTAKDKIAKELMSNPGKQYTTRQINEIAGSTEGTRRFREIRDVDYRFHLIQLDDRTWRYWFK